MGGKSRRQSTKGGAVTLHLQTQCREMSVDVHASLQPRTQPSGGRGHIASAGTVQRDGCSCPCVSAMEDPD